MLGGPNSHAHRWSSGRASALDVGRGIAILSVIYGHALAPWFMSAGVNFSEGAFLQWKFGASFMMVFFFFLSGVGWREDKSLATTLRQALALILIAWIASAAFDVARLAASMAGLAPALGIAPLDPVRFFRGLARMAVFGDLYSLTALWFLVALAVVRIGAAVTIRYGQGALLGLGAVLLTLTLIGTTTGWRNIYQVNLIGVAYAAFVVGHFARGWATELVRKPTAAYALLLVCGAATVATFHLNDGCRWDIAAQCGQDWIGGRFGVSMVIGQFGNWPMFALTAAFGTAFAMALAALIARFGGVAGAKLDAWGRNSLNLLIVNALFLHLLNPQVERWLAPRIQADNPLFFIGLFVLTMVANLVAVHALARPLKALNNFATRLAREMIERVRRAYAAIVARRTLRVSQGHD